MGSKNVATSDQKFHSWQRIYNEHSFPFDVRFHLDDWFETMPWGDLKSDEAVATQVYHSLIVELEKKIEETSLDQLSKSRLIFARNKIQDYFCVQHIELVNVLKSCFTSELNEGIRIASTESNAVPELTEEDTALLQYRQKETKFREVIAVLRQHSQTLGASIRDFHTFMQSAVAAIRDRHDQLNMMRRMLVKTNGTIDPQRGNQDLMRFETEINEQGQIIKDHRSRLASELTKGSEALSRVLHDHCWPLVAHYKQQQKLTTCNLAKPPDGAIDTINKVCEESCRQLKAYIQYIDRILPDVNLVVATDNDMALITITRVKTELEDLLGQHLREIFVITKQPQNVLRIENKKSPALSMCVRMLGGHGLGLEHTLPYVTVRVYNESMLNTALEADGPTVEGLCKSVENGEVQMEFMHATGHIRANLDRVRMLGVKQLERMTNADPVTYHKCGIVFYTKVHVWNKFYYLKVLSLPIVLTTQTSQFGAAKGTMIWDAAFSKQNRQLYKDEARIPWSKMDPVIRAMFKETGRELGQDQINYIAHYIFKTGPLPLGEDYSNCILTKDKFLKELVPGCRFTFWMWIYACKNLLELVGPEWKNKIIHGFIGRKKAERLLQGQKPGTFLLRFKEQSLAVSQCAKKCACLAVAYVTEWDPVTEETIVDHIKDYLTPTDIHNYSLIRILSAIVDEDTKERLLTTLYPDVDIEDLRTKYLVCAGETSGGYKKTQLLIGVKRAKQKVPISTDRSICDDSMSPESLLPPSPASWMENMPLSPTLPADLEDISFDSLIVSHDADMGLLTRGGDMLKICGDNTVRLDSQIAMSAFELQNGYAN